MTLAAVTPVNRYTGNGLASVYAFEWLLPTADDLVVMTYDPVNDVGAILALGVDFTLPATAVNVPAGGSITLTAGNLAAGVTLTLLRAVPADQTTSIRSQADFFPFVHEDTFDRLVMQYQQALENLTRAVALPSVVDPDDFDPSLPRNITLRPNFYLKVNAAGNGLDLTSVAPPADITVYQKEFDASVNTSLFTYAPPINTKSLVDVDLIARRVSGGAAGDYVCIRLCAFVQNIAGVITAFTVSQEFAANQVQGGFSFSGNIIAGAYNFKFQSGSSEVFNCKTYVRVRQN